MGTSKKVEVRQLTIDNCLNNVDRLYQPLHASLKTTSCTRNFGSQQQ